MCPFLVSCNYVPINFEKYSHNHIGFLLKEFPAPLESSSGVLLILTSYQVGRGFNLNNRVAEAGRVAISFINAVNSLF